MEYDEELNNYIKNVDFNNKLILFNTKETKSKSLDLPWQTRVLRAGVFFNNLYN